MNSKLKRQRNSARSGFTLIELILVVVIIGILVGIAVPRFSGRVEQTQKAAAADTIHSIGIALDLFELDNGRYPSSLNGLISDPGISENWHGPYMKEGRIPKDPWGNPYQYSAPGTHNEHSYDLSSNGPEGGEQIANWE